MTAIIHTLMAILAMLHAPHHKPAPAPQERRVAPVRVSRGVPRTTLSPGPCGGWRALVARYSWDVDKACRVLMCESGGNPNAIGPPQRVKRKGRWIVVYPRSLMQVVDGPMEPEANIAQAHAMYVRRGWQPWECQ